MAISLPPPLARTRRGSSRALARAPLQPSKPRQIAISFKTFQSLSERSGSSKQGICIWFVQLRQLSINQRSVMSDADPNTMTMPKGSTTHRRLQLIVWVASRPHKLWRLSLWRVVDQNGQLHHLGGSLPLRWYPLFVLRPLPSLCLLEDLHLLAQSILCRRRRMGCTGETRKGSVTKSAANMACPLGLA